MKMKSISVRIILMFAIVVLFACATIGVTGYLISAGLLKTEISSRLIDNAKKYSELSRLGGQALRL